MTSVTGTVNAQHASTRSRAGSRRLAALLTLPMLLWACSEQARLPDGADKGAKPTLPDPKRTLLPTVNIAPAVRWREGQTPQPAPGLAVRAFASGLEHPRWLHVLPNGDVLVAESNAPPRPEEGQGIKGWVMTKVMARAGAGVPSANRLTLLRDSDGDGTAETRSVFLQGLNSPFGMALVGDRLYVAHTDAVMEYPYTTGQAQITAPGRRLIDLPGGPRNHHWTKSLIASADGSKLYATVGSNSNVAEHGMAVEEGRAAIWEIERVSGAKRLFATGLRNPNGMAWTADGKLWTVVNERDELGSDLVPDYLTSVKDGAFYGWPYSWYGSYVDPRVSPPRPDLVAQAIAPDYALGAHVAPLGLAAAAPSPLTAALAVAGATSASSAPAASASATAASALAASAPAAAVPVHGMFVGLHGSWNRQPLSGYKVVYVAFEGDKPIGLPRDVLTGFVNAEGGALGRPVGVAIDGHGALLVADDVGNVVWRVMPR